jgi:hypothetical protein
MKMEQSVPKRRRIKFRRLGITQKKAYNEIHLFLNISIFLQITLAAEVLLRGGQLRHVKQTLKEVKSARFIFGTQALTDTER